jgi:hypothetical protein
MNQNVVGTALSDIGNLMSLGQPGPVQLPFVTNVTQ